MMRRCDATVFRAQSKRGICGATVAILAIVSLPESSGGELDIGRTRDRSWRLSSPELSESFAGELQRAIESIPDAVWNLVDRAGWRVEAVEYVIDAAPSLRGTSPRGWPAGWLWDNTDAVHMPGTKQLVIAEKRRTRSGLIVPCNRVAGVLRHEFGHAFDIMSGQPAFFDSASSIFRAAYESDTARMNREQRSRLRYYLQSGVAGRQEAFAESFAVMYGGGSDVEQRAHFEAAFRRSIAAVRVLVDHRVAAAPPPDLSLP